ncbi:MAG: nucleotide exchange factor GrpE [Ruminococcus sp.]|nr:nucleotide exchange factor GrpE [Ruminococcus sp.]
MNEITEEIVPENTGQEVQSLSDGDEVLSEPVPESAAETETNGTNEFAQPASDEESADNAPDEPPADEPDDEYSPVLNRLDELRGDLLGKLVELEEDIHTVNVQLTAANRAVAVHEEIERNLNSELQKYKNEFYDKLASPFLMQFIGLYIDMTEELDELRTEKENAPDSEFLKAYIKSLEYYADSVRGVLTNNSVEIRTPAPGDKYDYLEHRISKTVPAEDPALRDCIASVKSSAFVYNGKVLRPAKVAVYKVSDKKI